MPDDLTPGLKGAVRAVLLKHTHTFRGYISPGCNSQKLTFSECLSVFAQPDWHSLEEALRGLVEARHPGPERSTKQALADIGKRQLLLVSMKRFSFKRRDERFSRQQWLDILQKLFSDLTAVRLVHCKRLDALQLLDHSLLQPKPSVVWAPPQQWEAWADGYESVEDVTAQFDRLL